MKITDLKIYLLDVPLRTPFITALRRVDQLTDVILELHTDTGNVGYGEAPPTKAITGETLETICADLNGPIRSALMKREIEDLSGCFRALDACMEHHTSSKACADIALYDLYGQLKGKSIAEILGRKREMLETDLTISVNDPETMAEDAVKGIRRGFRTLKVKAGIDPELDTQRLAAVRNAVGSNIAIRIDANQAWTPEQAVSILEEMQKKGINLELAEQPVKADDLDGMAFVTARSPIPIVADESCFSPDQAEYIFRNHCADLVNIKLMKTGGIHHALEITDLAEKYGASCMLGCMLEAKVSVNAAVHLACSRTCITKIDLDGPLLCAEDPVHGGSAFKGPEIYLSREPGSGIRKIDGLHVPEF